MLKITVELLPQGNLHAKRTVLALDVVNDCTSTDHASRNYQLRAFGPDGTLWREARLTGFGRANRDHAALAAEALRRILSPE